MNTRPNFSANQKAQLLILHNFNWFHSQKKYFCKPEALGSWQLQRDRKKKKKKKQTAILERDL